MHCAARWWFMRDFPTGYFKDWKNCAIQHSKAEQKDQ